MKAAREPTIKFNDPFQITLYNLTYKQSLGILCKQFFNNIICFSSLYDIAKYMSIYHFPF